MEVKIATTQEEQEQAFLIRQQVFVDEQGVPLELEMDGLDVEAIHFICIFEGKVVGASRLRFLNDAGKLERICVLKGYRGKSLGKELISIMEKMILEHGYSKATLNSQVSAKDFYVRLGYKIASSSEFYDAGILHVTMEKDLHKER